MNRPVQLTNGALYLRGLLEDGQRKSLEPLTARLGDEPTRAGIEPATPRFSVVQRRH